MDDLSLGLGFRVGKKNTATMAVRFIWKFSDFRISFDSGEERILCFGENHETCSKFVMSDLGSHYYLILRSV
jgi:hypothetical protein